MDELLISPATIADVFVPFNKIARLSRTVIVTEKIDGTNAQIAIDGYGTIRAGSRTRWITPGKTSDNHGFAAWVEANKEELLKLGPGRHYGEWWGQGIQRGYDIEEKRFSLFHKEGIKELPSIVSVVPKLYEGAFDTDMIDAVLLDLKEGGSIAAPYFMKPEGIVIYHTASKQLFKKTIENDEQPKSEVKS